MKLHRNSPWFIAVTIFVIGMLSWACSFSTGNLTSNAPAAQPTLTSVSPGTAPTNLPAMGAGTPAATPAAQPTTAAIPQTGGSAGQGQQPVTQAPGNLEDIYANSNPGVVSILVQVNQNGQAGEGAGSGFILDDQTHIVTNHHVIDGASSIVVRYYNN